MWRLTAIILFAIMGCGAAAAEDVPLPRPRPPVVKPPAVKPPSWAPRADWREPQSFREAAGPDFKSADVTTEPSACRLRLKEFAVIAAMPRLIGPGSCGGSDIVRLDAVKLAGGLEVQIQPAPYLQCAMAEQVALWVRDDTAPQVAATGAVLRQVMTYDDFNCRGRNRKHTGKVSEHGKANALDVRGLTFTDGRFAMLTDTKLSKDLRAHLRTTACVRFTTVLGPGSDGYHEEHIHLDFAQRHNGYRICQWDVREPKPPGPPKVPIPPEAPAPPDAKIADAPAADQTETRAAPAGPSSGMSSGIAAAAANTSNVAALTIAVPLPKARPKPHRTRRKARGGVHFPFNLFR